MDFDRFYLDKCRNMHGPLSPEIKERITRLILNPTVENWEDSHSIIIQLNPMLTLWQAWVATDPNAPRTGRRYDFEGNMIREWQRTPTPIQIVRALKYATEEVES